MLVACSLTVFLIVLPLLSLMKCIKFSWVKKKILNGWFTKNYVIYAILLVLLLLLLLLYEIFWSFKLTTLSHHRIHLKLPPWTHISHAISPKPTLAMIDSGKSRGSGEWGREDLAELQWSMKLLKSFKERSNLLRSLKKLSYKLII